MNAQVPEPRSGIALDAEFRRLLAGDPARPYIEEKGSWTTLGVVNAIAEALFLKLDEAELPGDAAIGLIARNRMPHIAVLYGLLSRRRTIVMLHAYQAREKLAEEIRSLGLAAVIGDAEDWESDVVREAAGAAGTLGLAIGGGAANLRITVPIGAGPAAEYRTAPGVAIEMLTSGTTGQPKRVPISYEMLGQAVEDAVLATAQAGTTDTDAPYVQFYPLGNISGLFGLIACAVRGQPVVLLEKFTVDQWVRAVEAYRPSAFMSLPPAALRMVFDAEVPAEALSSISVLRCGSAPLDPELQAAFEARYGIPILINYGATEFCGVIANWTLDDHRRFAAAKLGSVGRARPGVKLRVVDPASGAELAAGETGQLEVCAERMSPDWVRTTDLAAIDEDGFLFLKGRADSVIIRGGFKISPEAVAEVLRGHPAIGDAGVVGQPDPRLGEVPVAAVELREGARPPGESELAAMVRAALSAQAVPVRILFLERLPRTQSLKVDRAALARIVAESE